MAFDLGNGLSAAGTAVAATAGAYTLEAQKAELEKDKITMADALAGKRESAGRQEQGMINATAADKLRAFQGGENDKQRASELDRTNITANASRDVAGMQAAASNERTKVEREALTPAEVRTAMWFSKASPDEKKAFQTQLLIKSGLPAWAAGGSSDTSPPPATTGTPGATVTPSGTSGPAGSTAPGSTVAPVGGPAGSMDDTGATAPAGAKSEKKADAGVPAGLPMPAVDTDKLNQIQPEARPTVKAMIEGRMPAPSSFAMSKPYWQTMMSLAQSVDPTFDQTSWQSRLSTRRDFTSGKSAVAVTALNTALGHAGVVTDALDKVDNGSIPMWNAIANRVGTEFGSNKVTNATQAVDALASEARKVFAASGGGNLTELQEWQKNFPINGSKEQQQGAMKLFVNLLDSRLGALSDQYNRGMGTANEPLKLLEPHAREVFERLSGNAPDNSTGYQTGKPTPSPDQKPAPVALPPANKRVIGRLYPTPTGTRPWLGEVDGKGWGPVQQSKP